MRGESLSNTESDWPRLELLVLVYGGSQWSSDWILGVKFPKQTNKPTLSLVQQSPLITSRHTASFLCTVRHTSRHTASHKDGTISTANKSTNVTRHRPLPGVVSFSLCVNERTSSSRSQKANIKCLKRRERYCTVKIVFKLGLGSHFYDKKNRKTKQYPH